MMVIDSCMCSRLTAWGVHQGHIMTERQIDAGNDQELLLKHSFTVDVLFRESSNVSLPSWP